MAEVMVYALRLGSKIDFHLVRTLALLLAHSDEASCHSCELLYGET